MPNEELENQISELNSKLETQKEEAAKEIEEVRKLINRHNVRDMIRRSINIDAKKYKVGGTAGKNATATMRNAADDGSCTIIVTNGIITGGTCF